VLAGGGFFFLKRPHGGAGGSKGTVPDGPKSGAGSPTSGVLGPLPAKALLSGAIIHWLSGENMNAWADGHGLAQPAKPGDPVLNWHDLNPDAGDAILTACGRRRESCPVQVVEQSEEFKDPISLLRFESGNCMAHKADPASVKKYPFGEDVKDKGLTLFLIVRPRIAEGEVTCLRLASRDGSGWLQLQASSKNEFRARAGVRLADGKDIVKECRVGGRNTKVFSLVSLRWDPELKKIILMVRSGNDGAKSRGDCDVPPDSPVLDEIHFSEAPGDPAHPPAPDTMFTGDIHELLLWPFVMTQDQHADQAQRLAEHYFKNPGSKW
jgi:hypothetical protein